MAAEDAKGMTSSKSRITAQIALFRRLALNHEGAIESSHMNQPDFRFNNRIFATLSYQDKGCGVLSSPSNNSKPSWPTSPTSSLPYREAGDAWA
jgi:hypothetical protein